MRSIFNQGWLVTYYYLSLIVVTASVVMRPLTTPEYLQNNFLQIFCPLLEKAGNLPGYFLLLFMIL